LDVDKVVMIGQAPSRDTDGAAPFSGRSGSRLAELARLEHARLGDVFELRNVIERWPGSAGRKGDRFPMPVARERAVALAAELTGRRVVFVGHAVSRAFGVKVGQGALMRWLRVEHLDFDFAVVPHPSGINTWWNDPDNRDAAGRFLSALAEEAPCAA
jgi:uracil-DNA glycosylase